jgi:hypothetical protein
LALFSEYVHFAVESVRYENGKLHDESSQGHFAARKGFTFSDHDVIERNEKGRKERKENASQFEEIC